MTLRDRKWKEFKLIDIFDNIALAKGDNQISKLLPGEIPLVSSGVKNNGIAGYILEGDKNSELIDGDKITIDMFGNTFYRPYDFYCVSHGRVIILYPKSQLGYEVGTFLATVIGKRTQEKYSFSNMASLSNVPFDVIELPVDSNDNIDYQFIKSYINTLDNDVENIPDYFLEEGYDKAFWYMDNVDQDIFESEYANSQSNTSVNLNERKWNTFLVEDIFEILNGKGITTTEINEHIGDFSTVQSSENNNGIMGYIDLEYCKEMNYTYYEGPCLTVARSGSSGYVSYQPNGCCVGDSAKILVLKEHPADEKEVLVFLQTILMQNKFKYLYARKVTEDIYKKDELLLPVNDENEPDYRFMSDYIKSLPFSCAIV